MYISYYYIIIIYNYDMYTMLIILYLLLINHYANGEDYNTIIISRNHI